MTSDIYISASTDQVCVYIVEGNTTPDIPLQFRVPAGVSVLNVELNGGNGQNQTYGFSGSGSGGLGAFVSGTISLTKLSNSILYFFVGNGGGVGGSAR